MKRALILTHAAIVRNIWFVGLVVLAGALSGPAAFALDPLGPPRAGVRQGEFSVGADLSYSQTDLKLVNGRWFSPPSDPPTGDPGNRTIKDFETIKLHATVGYGFAENWEAFLGIGATKAEFGDDLWSQNEDFDSGIGLGVRGGARTTIFEIPEWNVQVGGLIQINWANYDGKIGASDWPALEFLELELTEMQIAVGATYLWEDGFIVYAGPFVHYVEGDLEELSPNVDITWDIDAGPVWGGFLGAQWELAENCTFNVEYQQSSDASVFAAGVMFVY